MGIYSRLAFETVETRPKPKLTAALQAMWVISNVHPPSCDQPLHQNPIECCNADSVHDASYATRFCGGSACFSRSYRVQFLQGSGGS